MSPRKKCKLSPAQWAMIGTIVVALVAGMTKIIVAFLQKSSTPTPSPTSCQIEASEISVAKTIVKIGETIKVSVLASNPDGKAMLYNWQASNGSMNPGLRSPTSESVYTPPSYGTEDTISVDITMTGCEVRRSMQISVIESVDISPLPIYTLTPPPAKTPTPSRTPTLIPTPNATQIALATASPSPDVAFVPIIRGDDNGNEQVWVPPGAFIAGDNFGDGDANETPLHQVYTDGFWIDRYLVTNHGFSQCPEALCGFPALLISHKRPNGYYGQAEYNDYPVMQITWQQASDYCHWLSGRLPTEAEFEKASGWDPRTGKMREYPWGNDSPSEDRANYAGVDRDTTPVKQYPKGMSAIGAYDMSGNLWEWTADWYSATYYADNQNWINPTGPITGERRVVRGGSWDTTNTSYLRTSNRGTNVSDNSGNEIGFRCDYDK